VRCLKSVRISVVIREESLTIVGKRNSDEESRREVLRLYATYLADSNSFHTDDPILRHHAYYQWLETKHEWVASSIKGPDKVKRIAHWIEVAGL